MANLSVILKKIGKNITGTDLEEKFITDGLLKKHNISYSIGFKPEVLPEGTDLVIYSAAHGGINNPIAIESKKRNIPIISQTEVLASIMKEFKTSVAVSGCHGKTTTSSHLSYSLIQLGVKPSYLVGAPSFNEYEGGDYKDKDCFIIEADEYGVNPPTDLRPKFHFLSPDYTICTNIDFDHPDIYKNLEDTKKAFLIFFDKKKLILCADDSNLMSVAKNIPREQYQTYGFAKDADRVITEMKTGESGMVFRLNGNEYAISLFGEKNVSNAAAVIVTLLTLGFPADKIRCAIKDFTGAKRRFEKVFENENFSLYDDYGHHPHEIEATISAARTHFPSRRIIMVFQPHTYSRTQMLLNEFAQALSLADYSCILPIFPSAREDKSKFNVTSEDIIKTGMAKNSEAANGAKELISKLKVNLKKNDVLFTMGAGDVYKLKDDIVKLLISKS